MKEFMEWVYCILIAIVLVLVIKTFVGTPTIVKQTSMFPTLKQNERLWLSRWGVTFNKELKRGEIITFEAPTESYISEDNADLLNPVAKYSYTPNNVFSKFVYYILEWGGKKSYIKRVIALPGEHVLIENGKVYVNDVQLAEEYLQESIITTSLEGAFIDITVPEGCIYVLGDNRAESTDSRRFGCIPIEKIESRAIFRFWPLNVFGGI